MPLDQYEKRVSELFVDNYLKSVPGILPAFLLTDARVQDCKVFHMLQYFLDPVAILVEGPSRLLEVPRVECTLYKPQCCKKS